MTSNTLLARSAIDRLAKAPTPSSSKDPHGANATSGLPLTKTGGPEC
ncbi:hypothetical protein [Arthrobacter sp. A5]